MRRREAVPRRLFLRIYLAMLALLIALATAIGVSGSVIAFRRGVDAAEQLLAAQAQAANGRLGDFFKSLQSAMAEPIRVPVGPASLGLDDLRVDLERLLRQRPEIRRIAVRPPGSDEWLDLSRLRSPCIGRDCASDLRLESAAAATEVLAASGQQQFSRARCRDASEPYALVDVRLSPDGGWAVAELDLRWMEARLHEIETDLRGRVYVVDDRGRLLAHRDRGLLLTCADLSTLPAIARRLGLGEARDHAIWSTDVRGGDVLSIGLRNAMTGWIIVADRDAVEITRAAWQVAALTAGVALALAVLAALFAWWLARRLAKPIEILAASVPRSSTSIQQVQRRGSDEVQLLEDSIEAMARQVRDYTESLEVKVVEKTRELAQANEHKSQFLANVSHELRTPLNAIIGYSEALKEDIFGALSPKQRECADDIHSSGLHLLALINDLLDLSKVEAGRIDLDLAPFAVSELVERSLGVLRERAARGGVELRAEIGAEVGTWAGDELRLRQSVMNLLSNAVKFTRPGGMVTLSVRQTSGQLQIAVADTGVGIPEDQLPRLFERFSRIQNAAAEGFSAPKGTGLGLALTRSFVELHGGRITVTSRVGEGTTFTIALPAMTQAGDVEEDADENADGNGAGG